MTPSICFYYMLILSAGHFSFFDTRSVPTRVDGRIVGTRTGDPVDGYGFDLFKDEYSLIFFGRYDQTYVKSFGKKIRCCLTLSIDYKGQKKDREEMNLPDLMLDNCLKN